MLRRLLVLAATGAALAAGPHVSAASEDNPTVMSWRAGRADQLGNGTLSDSLSPTSVTSLFRGDVDQISADGTSSADSFALARTDKTVRSWEHNSSGQLGDSANTDQAVPTGRPTFSGAIIETNADSCSRAGPGNPPWPAGICRPTPGGGITYAPARATSSG
ncbi:hypothetical protein [Streptomyces sp. AcE210]|uniref:hypothetical protein n=1 Tax=Streptomyces sp. AcE210 TaxID=2292703 RepID=UPI001F0BE900|nr:hypothetical protein [Streptomyces sp. AcE210]